MIRPFVVGMGGGTASGKTTLAEALDDALGHRCLLLNHDRYYRSLPAGTHPLDFNFDHPDALETSLLVADLDVLRDGRPADLPVYDFANHRRSESRDVVQPHPLIIVEGILVLSDPALREQFDLTIYVDCPDDVRLIRRIRRDLQKRGRTVDQVLAQWERTVAPMHREFVAPCKGAADHLFDGTQPVPTLLGRFQDLVGSHAG